jgi:hypothetical protein
MFCQNKKKEKFGIEYFFVHAMKIYIGEGEV